jgi:hypothetical protein
MPRSNTSLSSRKLASMLRSSKQSSHRPPQIKSNIIFGHRYRFTSTGAASIPITVALLRGVGGVVATSATTGTPIAFSVKVRSVEIWTPPASQGASATCSLEWSSGSTLDSTSTVEISDTTMSTAEPAHLRTSPPKTSLASFWQHIGADQLFVITAPAGSVVDVSVQFIQNDNEASPTVVTLAGATTGNMYYMPLDGHGGVMAPVSLTLG